MKLHTNMRLKEINKFDIPKFSKYLLNIGNGKEKKDIQTGKIQLCPTFCNLSSNITDLIDKVYPNLNQHITDHKWLQQRGILSTTNLRVNEINSTILETIPGESHSYYSIHTVLSEDETTNYPVEFLNSLNPSGLPQHNITLKYGSPIMLLRNLDPPKLCNGTRLVVKKLNKHIIEATILTDAFKGENVFIPRIPLIPTDLPFNFKRLQFPVRLGFAITINKSQGQSLNITGIDLRDECFSHGQLYVAMSRAKDPKNLYILTNENNFTKNIVYTKILKD